MSEIVQLTVSDFAGLFGTTVGDFSFGVRAMIEKYDFRFVRLDKARQMQIMDMIQKRLAEDTPLFAKAGEKRQGRWQEGWSENLHEFEEGGCDVEKLVPKYYDRPGTPVRFLGEYVEPVSSRFELNLRRVFAQWLFEKYFTEAQAVYEFGCGSGMNLAMLAQMYPKKQIVGLDWAPASRDIAEVMRARCGWDVRGEVFDMFKPEMRGDFGAQSALLAFHALEQLGKNFDSFLQFVLEHKFACFVHVDGIEELYDPHVPLDALALQFHRKRNYLSGYLSHLQELANVGRIQLMRVHRVHVGNLYHDAYSYVVWRPV